MAEVSQQNLTPATPPQLKIVALQAFLLVGELIAAIWMIERIVSAQWIEAVCLGQFTLTMATASVVIYCAIKRRKHVYDPLRKIEALLPEIRAGHVMVEELSQIEGQLGPIARQMEELLRETRAQKGQLVELEEEMRQRIANRTEALERKIGSLQHQATRDPLTGLLNRRALNQHLAKSIERSGTTGIPLSVLMIDVDNFKPLNDTLGHAAGDDLLRSIGQLLRSTLRENDAGFRCGGDEFVIVLEGCDLKFANTAAERVTALVDALTKPLKVANRPRLSIGAACINEVPEQTAEALLHKADTRLYEIKSTRKSSRSSPPANPQLASTTGK